LHEIKITLIGRVCETALQRSRHRKQQEPGEVSRPRLAGAVAGGFNRIAFEPDDAGVLPQVLESPTR
jgi:hypothetical protein